MGHVVTSRWLDTDWLLGEDRTSSAAPPEYRTEYAVKDIADVIAADVVVNFAEPERSGRGGRHVELGAALALDKPCLLVGKPEHIFHYHPYVTRLADDAAMLHWFKEHA